MRRVKNLIGFFFLSLLYFISEILIPPFFRNPTKRLKVRLGLVSFFSRKGLSWIGIKVVILGRGQVRKGGLYVANHMSFVDIWVLASVLPARFVPGGKVQNDRLLGIFSALGGSLFINRKRPSTLRQNIKDLISTLQAGISVLVFPEGETTDGSAVLPFKSALFQTALEAKVPVVPLAISYIEANGRPFSNKDADRVFYYGDRRFFPQFWNLLGYRSLVVEVKYLDSPKEGDFQTRRDLAQQSQTVIESQRKKPLTL